MILYLIILLNSGEMWCVFIRMWCLARTVADVLTPLTSGMLTTFFTIESTQSASAFNPSEFIFLWFYIKFKQKDGAAHVNLQIIRVFCN